MADLAFKVWGNESPVTPRAVMFDNCVYSVGEAQQKRIDAARRTRRQTLESFITQKLTDAKR
jgi:hypothetical protein